MFLFLSKVLPLFLYPIGLVCVLLTIALISLIRRPKRSRLALIPIGCALILLLASSNGWVTDALVKSLENQNIPKGELPTADAIVILGGATRSKNPPRPWVEVMEAGDRVLYGAKLYRDGKAPKVILSGGRIAWEDQAQPESADMAELIMTMGVPISAIIQDTTSLNTRENAVNVQKILQQQGIKKILLVTSALHMPRSRLIFQKLGIDAIPAPTDYLTSRNSLGTGLEATVLNALPDEDSLRNTTKALKEYIGTFIYRLRGWA